MTAARWTCARCEMTARWMPGRERAEGPPGWIEREGATYCLSCSRELAGEAALSAAPADATAQHRAQLKRGALVEFEVERDPDRSDGEIARAVRTSVAAVAKARERLASGDPD